MRSPLRVGQDARRNWRRINELDAALARTDRAVEAQGIELAGMGRLAAYQGLGLHPFRLYRLTLRRVGWSGGAEWRTFRVRAGRVMGTDVTSGTDGVADPDGGVKPDGPFDVVVPENCPRYWFWLDLSGTPMVRHGEDPAQAGWSGFPEPDAEHVPIGWVDTRSKAAEGTAVVRQFLRGDLVVAGGGGAEIKRYRVKSVAANYLVCRTWDGAAEGGADVKVAKPPELRHVASEVVEGVTISYTYQSRANNLDGQRLAGAAGFATQTEIVIPVWRVNSEIWAMKPAGGTGVTEAAWLDLNVAGRMWCQVMA
jgi:hypothetical protein